MYNIKAQKTMKNVSKLKFVSIAILMVYSIVFMGCSKGDEKEDDNKSEDETEYDGSSSTNKITKPQISTVIAVGAVDEFNVVFKVISNEEPSSVTLYYGKSQSTSTPSLSSSRECRRDYSHSGGKNTYFYNFFVMASKDTYVFFYAEATNSAGTSKTSVSYQRIR